MEAVNGITLRIRTQAAKFWSNQFFRFLVVGAGNTVFGYGVYLLCLLIGIPYQAAAVVATVLGVIFNFFTTGAIVFRNATLGKIVGFFAVYGVMLIVNLIVLTWLVENGISKALAQAISLPLIVILSFLLNKYIVFRETT